MKIFFPPSVIMHLIAGKCLSNQPAKQHGVVRRINREDWALKMEEGTTSQGVQPKKLEKL